MISILLMTLVNLTRTDETKIITTSWLTVEYYKYYKYYHILPFRICSWDVATWDGRGTGGQGDHGSPTPISEPNKAQQIEFQTSGILLFTSVQKLYEPEI